MLFEHQFEVVQIIFDSDHWGFSVDPKIIGAFTLINVEFVVFITSWKNAIQIATEQRRRNDKNLLDTTADKEEEEFPDIRRFKSLLLEPEKVRRITSNLPSLVRSINRVI